MRGGLRLFAKMGVHGSRKGVADRIVVGKHFNRNSGQVKGGQHDEMLDDRKVVTGGQMLDQWLQALLAQFLSQWLPVAARQLQSSSQVDEQATVFFSPGVLGAIAAEALPNRWSGRAEQNRPVLTVWIGGLGMAVRLPVSRPSPKSCWPARIVRADRRASASTANSLRVPWHLATRTFA